MKLTMINKDHIARLIAEKAYTLPTGGNNDHLYNTMLRVSEALEMVGETGSQFRKLNDLRTTKLPPITDEKDRTIETEMTYFDGLLQAMQVVMNAA